MNAHTKAHQIASEIGKPENAAMIARQLSATDPTLRAAHTAHVHAVSNAETPEQITARRRAERWEHIRSLTSGTLRLTPVTPAEPTNPNAPDDPVFDYTAASHSYFGRL